MTGEQGTAKGRTRGQTMSQVTVTINGRQFRMACEDGQEGHLMRLAQELDQRIEKLRGNFGEIRIDRQRVGHRLWSETVLWRGCPSRKCCGAPSSWRR